MSNENNDDFREFIDREADKTAKFAGADDLIEFAFGDLESAVEAFEKIRGKRYKKATDYLDDDYFFGFVSDEFDSVRVYASDEEMADWAYGSVGEAEEEIKDKQDED